MEYKVRLKAILLLADGTIFYGKSVYGKGTAFGEVCFNTGMTGYQEIFTDPSYFGQLMVMTNPHIGNYGVNNDEIESDSIKISGLICKNFSYNYSRTLADNSLEEFLSKNKLFAISDVDTRALVSYIRKNGAMNAVITTDINNVEELIAKLNDVPSMKGLELASKVSTKTSYFFGDENSSIKVAVLDLGIKKKYSEKFS
jgi:carbamoyl-phosphate synthase small subunit